MYTYITKELPMIIKANFPAVDATRAGIFGHSMGGMGALQVRYLPFSSLEI
jgi:S-formylglutathione hydrolase